MIKTKKAPYLHQVEATKRAISHFKKNDRGQLHMACGTGKTLTSLLIANELNAKNIIILLPSLQLQEQTLSLWISEADMLKYTLIAVGSDYSFSRKYNIKTTTEISEIQTFIVLEKPKIIFSTYQSFEKVLLAANKNFTFDFGIVDEAHNMAGHNDKKYSSLLFDSKKLHIKKLLFMTGTPKFLEGEEFVSMDNLAQFGKIIYKLSLEEAIRKNILSDYKLLVMYISQNDILIEQNIKNQIINYNQNSTPLNYLALKLFVEKVVEKYKIKKLLSFHKSKSRAQIFSKLLKSETIQTYNINCDQNVNNRIKLIENFKKDEVSCICNPRIMIEGFDLPQIDSIIFADLKNSKQDYLQAVGRALRRFPQKKLSYILLPIFINQNGIINKKEYNIYTDFLSNLALNDNRIYNYFSKQEPFSEILELNDSVDISESQISNLNKAISVRVLRKISKSQFINYEEFKELIFYEKITSLNDYYKYFRSCKGILENNRLIPPKPNRFYAEWESWYILFGVQTAPIISYSEFKDLMLKYAVEFGIDNSKKYYAWAYNRLNFKIPFPKDFPRYPANYYDEWTNWLELFDKGKREYYSYNEFKIEILKLSDLLSNNYDKEYNTWYKENKHIKFLKKYPSNPAKKYKEWEGWTKIFNKVQIPIIDYQTFRQLFNEYNKTLNFQSAREYFKWAAQKQEYKIAFPKNFPKNPARAYKLTWEGWPTFYQTKNVSYKEFKERLIIYIEELGIKTGLDYLNWSKGRKKFEIEFPKDFPRYPNEYYTEWEGWTKILNKEKLFVNYSEFKTILSFYKRNYGINSTTKYQNWVKKKNTFGVEFPTIFPKNPDKHYKEWTNWKEIWA